jgi:RimJ/RimL family protein N-acetyltransferase
MIRKAIDEDKNLLNEIYSHEAVWPWIKDDNVTEEFRYKLGEMIFDTTKSNSIILTDGKFISFWLKPMNSICYEVHTAVTPDGRGQYAIDIGEQAINWMFDNTNCRKIISYIPVDNRAATLFSLKCGFKKEGLITDSFLKDGKIINQHIVGRAKKCQQQDQL